MRFSQVWRDLGELGFVNIKLGIFYGTFNERIKLSNLLRPNFNRKDERAGSEGHGAILFEQQLIRCEETMESFQVE